MLKNTTCGYIHKQSFKKYLWGKKTGEKHRWWWMIFIYFFLKKTRLEINVF